MTTPQVFLIMSGLGLLFYVLITGFRSSRKSISRHHRRQWWMGTIGGVAIALSPLSLYWRKPFNSIDLLTQSLIISFACMLGMLLFALLLVPYKAVRKIFRKKRQDVDLVLTRNADGLSPISINAEANTMLDHAPAAAMTSSAPLQSIYSTNIGEKSIAETINEAGEVHTDLELARHLNDVENSDQIISDQINDEFIDQDADQANNEQLAVTDIESAMHSREETYGAEQLDDSVSRSIAAKNKIDSAETKTDVSLEHTTSNASQVASEEDLQSDEEFQEDNTLRLDELGDETIQIDELADDTLQLDELLPNGEMHANSELHANHEQQAIEQQHVKAKQQTISERNTASEHEVLQNEETPQANEEELLTENGLWAEDELDIASIPSDEESFDLSETGDLFSEIRLQQTEVELPDEKELRDANRASADDEEFDLDTALLQSTEPKASNEKTSVRPQTEIEEADVIHNDIDLGVDETDLEFGNDLTGEYAHPAEEYEPTPEQADEHSLETEQTQTIDPITEHVAEQVADQPKAMEETETAAEPVAAQPKQIDETETTTERVEKQTEVTESTVKRVARISQEKRSDNEPADSRTQRKAEKRVPVNDVLVVHNTINRGPEPKTLATALVAAKLTAESVETQVSQLEQRIAKLDGYRSASIDSAHTNAEQHTVALEQTSALLTSEDEARRAAESVIAAQKAMLKRANEQQAELDALLEQERKHLRLLKGEVERSRKMARTAALLARKAAVAQQEIRSVAKREQTARLKSEESTRKAVNIARNAINALAEEERKRDLTQH